MTRIVSQDEIDVLLTADSTPASDVTPCNFRRAERITKEQLRSLHFVHERFAKGLSTALSSYLRVGTDVSLLTIEQLAYAEFLAGLPDPTAFYAISMKPHDTLAALELTPSIAFALVDRMLGGTGSGSEPDRPLTEIEQNIVDSVVKLLLEQLNPTWRGIVNAQLDIHSRETRPQMLKVTGRNEIVAVLEFSIKIGDSRGTLKFCVPAAPIEAASEKLAQAGQKTTRRALTAEETAHLSANLGRVPLSVSAHLSTTFSARELLALRPGDVVSLGRTAAQPVAVSIGEQPVYAGQLVVHQGNLAVRIEGSAPGADEGTLG